MSEVEKKSKKMGSKKTVKKIVTETIETTSSGGIVEMPPEEDKENLG